MLVQFEEVNKQVDHRGAKGREREAQLAQSYLQHYLPRNLELVHGAEILDSEGSRSSECDLVIQSNRTPPLMVGNDFHLIPVEWAYGLIEVKSNLTRDELADAQAKIARAKRLKKVAFHPQTGDVIMTVQRYGSKYEFFPLYGMIFAYTSGKLETLAAELWSTQSSLPMSEWVDATVVLDRGLLMYFDPARGYLFHPHPGCQLHAVASEEALLPATLCLVNAMSSVFERPATLGPYIGDSPWGSPLVTLGP
jgi:hypothetical protein